jgi:hypothetical protein
MREGHAKYGETYNGIHYEEQYKPRTTHLLPLVQAGDAGVEGEPEERGGRKGGRKGTGAYTGIFG